MSAPSSIPHRCPARAVHHYAPAGLGPIMDPPQQQQCDFHHAVYRNQVDVVRSMLAANPKRTRHARCIRKCFVLLLLTRSAPVANQADRHGNPPLHLAAHLRHKQMVLLLLEHGADVTAKNGGGWSSLQEARVVVVVAVVARARDDSRVCLYLLFSLIRSSPLAARS